MFSIFNTNEIIVQLSSAQFGDEGAQGTAGTTADGGASGGAGQVATGPFGDNFFPILMLLLVGMIVFSFFGGRKQKKRRASMLDSLAKSDQVLTRGGVFGTIVDIKPDRVVLKVDESSNTRITVLRESIEQVTAETTS
ncbi:MAG TPA: preprotein translocase subunit YajC [Phycisphaerales bacterium]|nr:preprotein translocase subunit YajC [Phycisphaerales bacterium]HIB51443.1 preprotein translocase subunit YajC [Phycisphaerales bacterium]HIN83511.1 preprotein translocase subunit YajC [Phycisphaerales bacterium]HIO52054.1 preprotein translocase subunit YajC [Phycisphaerales bacterium]